jgi:hypothetical protein
MSMRPVTRENFWARVRKTDSCWLWSGSLNTHGYGQVRLNGKQEVVSRVSWRWAYGAIPDGLNVLHHCDTPACVRPDHLFLGSTADNAADMVSKKRHRFGSRHPHSKLSEESVAEIRSRGDAGEGFTSISKDFPVTAENVATICKRRTWRHV